MKSLEDIKDMLCLELDEFAKKGELSAGGLETIHKLTDTIKNIEKIKMFEEYDDENSYRGGSYGSYRGNSYRSSNRGGYSNRHYVRGHYSNADDDMSYRTSRRYSREDGKEMIMEKLEEAMAGAETTKEREALERCMRQLENA